MISRETILDKVSETFTTVLEHKNFTLTNRTTANDVDGWESITHMMVISQIEHLFDIQFKLVNLMNMDSVGDLLDSIEYELQQK